MAIFKFRGDVDKITHVYIAGDLTVSNVTLRDKKNDFKLTAIAAGTEDVYNQ